MKKIFLLTGLIAAITANAQFGMGGSKDDSWKKQYRSFPTKINNLVHTKLQAKFDYSKSYLNGKVWLTLQPHFYATDSLQLDAKGMDINKVELVKGGKNIPLKYVYADSLLLNITLDRTYTANEKYTIYIDYTAKPDEFQSQGSAAITDAKGLYFINPKGDEKTKDGKIKPTQIWTQGETEATSVWVPTIDRTNQKTTQEIYMTVPAKYVTLSNGKLVSQTKNVDGTRTDYWKMDLPHAPYLLFMGVGDYAIVKDTYKGKEVNYYVEKEYEKVAKKIFGYTPEMMKFFSEKLGVEYPWNKYAQIVGLDYVSGAMENTTATLHQESAQQNARELVDGNRWEGTIAHELFHQWFGDYVTAESWSNLTVNESFADYSQTLWAEYKHGKDAGEEENYTGMQGYLQSGSGSKDLVRFYYRDKEDMFDAVSYNKGGRVLNMLRHFVGDEAFFKSLNKYLTDNKFGNGSATKLRLAFEAVTGKDLNWFFNQWYFGSGNPKLDISYYHNATDKFVSVYVKQTQSGDKIFKLPITIDVYEGNDKKRYKVWMEHKVDTFSFAVSSKPSLVNVDADKILLADKKDTKTLSEYAFQYSHATNYVDRRDALDYAAKHLKEDGALDVVKQALNDKFYKLQIKAIQSVEDTVLDATTIAQIEAMANNKKLNALVRAEAIDYLATLKKASYTNSFTAFTKDSSYSIAGAAFEALLDVDDAKALALLPELKKDAKGRLKAAVEKASLLTKTDADFDEMYNDLNNAGMMDKFSKYGNFITYLGMVNNTANFKKGLDMIVGLRNQVAGFAPQFKDVINKQIKDLKAKKDIAKTKGANTTDIDEQKAYIDEQTK
jgi:aminopeptidase N